MTGGFFRDWSSLGSDRARDREIESTPTLGRGARACRGEQPRGVAMVARGASPTAGRGVARDDHGADPGGHLNWVGIGPFHALAQQGKP